MTVRLRPLIVGTATYMPGMRNLTARRTGGTVSARYCYAVWMRHLVKAHANGLGAHFPTVAELGPGDSLGLGLAALLSGAERYVALDVVRYADSARNLAVLDDVIALFAARAPIPDADEFPLVRPTLSSYDFPHHILTEHRLTAALAPERLAEIRQAILALEDEDAEHRMIAYFVPWYDAGAIESESVDLIVSQAVLQYPADLAGIYAAMHRWLTPGGVMSHDIDFKAHGATQEWNGHWTCPDIVWSLIGGKRRDGINRASHSMHRALIDDLSFTVASDERMHLPSAITRDALAPRFHHLPDGDLTTSSAFIQAVKPR